MLYAVVVGLAERDARLHAAAGHPHREAAAVMIAAVIGRGEPALAIDRAAELAAPDHQRVVEHAALRQILNQPGGRLIDILAALRQVLRQARRGGPNRDGRAE